MAFTSSDRIHSGDKIAGHDVSVLAKTTAVLAASPQVSLFTGSWRQPDSKAKLIRTHTSCLSLLRPS